MKILHTADWHLGKIIHEQSLLDDQRHILGELIKIIQVHRPDVMIIAGDIYDRSQPGVEAIELLDETLSQVVLGYKLPVIAISGNHDNPTRIGFAGKILKDNGLYMVGEVQKDIAPIVLHDEHGEVNFYPVPFAEHAKIRELFSDDDIKNQDDAIKAIVNNIYVSMDTKKRNVCIAHSYIGSMFGFEKLVESDSERPLSVGNAEIINAAYFDKFCYTALGHLHKAQKALNDNIRYSGSILKYSFSESRHKKSVSMVDIAADGTVKIKRIPLTPLHDMRIIKGRLSDLISEKVYALSDTTDYIKAVLTDKGELLDAMYSLRSVYPNILKLEWQSRADSSLESGRNTVEEYAKMQPIDIVAEFYENVSGSDFDQKRRSIVTDVIKKIEQKERT